MWQDHDSREPFCFYCPLMGKRVLLMLLIDLDPQGSSTHFAINKFDVVIPEKVRLAEPPAMACQYASMNLSFRLPKRLLIFKRAIAII